MENFGPLLVDCDRAGNSLFEVYPWLPYAVAGSLMLVPIVMSHKFREPDASLEPSQS